MVVNSLTLVVVGVGAALITKIVCWLIAFDKIYQEQRVIKSLEKWTEGFFSFFSDEKPSFKERLFLVEDRSSRRGVRYRIAWENFPATARFFHGVFGR